MSDPSEVEDLDHLLASPGWVRLARYVKAEWTERIEQHLGHAVNDTDDLAALQKMRQVIAAKRAIEQMLAWPTDRLKYLRAQQANTASFAYDPSRRGNL